MDKIELKIIEILMKQEGSGKPVTLKTTFEELNFDSLDKVEIIMDLEDEFDIEIPDKDIKKITTVLQLIKYIKTRDQQG